MAALAALTLWACGGPSDPGERVFRKRCQQCHGSDGRGRTKFAEGRPFSDLLDEEWKHGADPASMRRLIADGDPKSPMPPFRDRLDPEEIDAVVQYVERLRGAAPREPKATP